MATKAHNEHTRISSKGQIVLPAAIRARRQWEAGTKLVVEETSDGVLLREASPFGPPSDPAKVYGMLKYDGPPVSIEDMNTGVLEEAARRHARSRY